MEKRGTKRITPGFKADLVFEGKTYTATVEDLSSTGICIIVMSPDTTVSWRPGTMFDLVLHSHSGETLKLNCRLKWLSKTPRHGLTSKMGMEVIDPPWDESNNIV